MGLLEDNTIQIDDVITGVRENGEMIVRKMVAHLDRGITVLLDCTHPLGQEHKGKFNMIQMKNNMFLVVCDKCTQFALLGEPIAGETSSKAIYGTA